MKQVFSRSVLMMSLSLAMLAGCNPAPVVTQPSATPSPQVSASPSPVASPSASPSAEPSPSVSPSASSSASPSADPSASATPSAGPSDISVGDKTTFNGKVYDDSNAPLDGVTVMVKSLSAMVPYEATTTSAGGAYAFNNAPAGIQLEISASKAGYTTRRRVEVLKSNKDGDPNANRYDFGTDGPATTAFGVAYNALSDKPEVISATPMRNASGIAAGTSFVLKFSEPMDRDTVEKNIGIYSASAETLSVDSVAPTTVQGFSDAFDTTPALGSLIWDESAFSVSWNGDDTEATLTFKDMRRLLSDRESENVPDYRVSLLVDDGQIKDKNGTTRAAADGGYFKLTDGNFEANYRFAIVKDEEEPEIDSVMALTAENGNIMGDEIKVVYSEPMVYYPVIGEVRGNMAGGTPAEDPIDPDNYMISVNGGPEVNLGTGLGGTALFDSNDASHRTVLLRFFGNLYTPGANIKVRALGSVVDPAGNSMDSANDEEDDTAN